MPGDFLAVCNDLLDGLVTRSDVRSVCLWKSVSLDEFEYVGCRPVRSSHPDFVRAGAAVAQWLDQSGPMAWRVTETPLFEVAGSPEGGQIYLSVSTGRLLLEVCSAGDLSERDVHEVSTLLGSLSQLMGEREATPDRERLASPTLQYELLDLTFVESVAMGDRDFVVEILSMSLEGFEDGWRSICTSLEAGDRTAAAAEAHKLRSTARTVGATHVDEVLLTLETAADLATARIRRPEVGYVIDGICVEIRATLDGMA